MHLQSTWNLPNFSNLICNHFVTYNIHNLCFPKNILFSYLQSVGWAMLFFLPFTTFFNWENYTCFLKFSSKTVPLALPLLSFMGRCFSTVITLWIILGLPLLGSLFKSSLDHYWFSIICSFLGLVHWWNGWLVW